MDQVSGLLKKYSGSKIPDPHDQEIIILEKGFCIHNTDCIDAKLGVRYFSSFRYSQFRYFNTSFRCRYSATFLKIAIRYWLFAIATFIHHCCGLHQF
jgi:hypothetical protein